MLLSFIAYAGREMIALCFLRYTVPNNGAASFDMSGNGDDNLDPGRAQDPQASLERQNERLQLLLNLTTRITSNLDLREVLRAIAANIREVMHADAVAVSLPDPISKKSRVLAVDFPHGKGVIKEELLLPLSSEAKRAMDTLKP